MDDRWRIEQLQQLVERALSAAVYDGQASGRVREVPDVRTIRYYTTLGLVDRPLEMRGRTAFYGAKHLLQLVAIKRLQAQGLSLEQVQQQLAATTQAELTRLAELPSNLFVPLPKEKVEESELAGPQADCPAKGDSAQPVGAPAPRQAAADTVAARRKFWAQPQTLSPAEYLAQPASPQPARTAQESIIQSKHGTVLELAPNVALWLAGVEPERMTEEVLASLETAAAGLRQALHQAGLLGSGHGAQGDVDQQANSTGESE